jgi:hypothetical protein
MDIDGTLRWVLWLILVAFALFLYFFGPGQSGVGPTSYCASLGAGPRLTRLI